MIGIRQIHSIYGHVAQYHPLRADRMQLAFNPRLLSHEWRVRSGQLGLWPRLAYFGRMLLQNPAGVVLFARNLDTEAVKWSRYRDESWKTPISANSTACYGWSWMAKTSRLNNCGAT